MAYIPYKTINLGITYSASTFRVTSSNGTALNSNNSGWVQIPSKTAGVNKLIQVTADQSFVDDSGSSTITGNLFGFGASDTLASNDVPFYIYAVLNDAETAVSFMISRTSGMGISPAAANIGKTGSAIADVSYAFFALNDPTVADYESNPCVMLGSFRMRLTTAGGDWTVQALNTTDGIGRFQEGIFFSLPTGVLGAASGSHFNDNGGTAPAWNSANYYYKVHPTGWVDLNYSAGGAPNTNGVGAVQAQLIKPFPLNSSFMTSIGYGNVLGVEIVYLSGGNTNYMSIASNGTKQNVYFSSGTAGFSGLNFRGQYYMKQI